MPNLQAIPRTVVRTYLQAARLPLAAAEQLFKQSDADDWAPTLAFDTLEAEVLQFVGSALRDEELVQQGRLVAAKVAQLRRASELEAEAEAKRAEAEAEFRARREADAAARERIGEQAAQREAAIKADKARKKRDAEAKASQKADAARKADAAQHKHLAKQDRAAAKARIAAEQRAVAEERRALAAEEQVLDLDAAIESTKAIRKAK